MPEAQHPLSAIRRSFRFALVLAAGWLLSAAGGSESGLPVPRFVSLHAQKANVRTGPGVRYPVDWVLVRRGMPVEIVAEFEHWRKIRDWQGTEGWVHQSMLSGVRTAVVMNEVRALRRSADAQAPVTARLEPGVIARVLACGGAWCRLDAAGFKGWIPRTGIWGVSDDETLD